MHQFGSLVFHLGGKGIRRDWSNVSIDIDIENILFYFRCVCGAGYWPINSREIVIMCYVISDVFSSV